jgi:hypothetical protein
VLEPVSVKRILEPEPEQVSVPEQARVPVQVLVLVLVLVPAQALESARIPVGDWSEQVPRDLEVDLCCCAGPCPDHQSRPRSDQPAENALSPQFFLMFVPSPSWQINQFRIKWLQ